MADFDEGLSLDAAAAMLMDEPTPKALPPRGDGGKFVATKPKDEAEPDASPDRTPEEAPKDEEPKADDAAPDREAAPDEVPDEVPDDEPADEEKGAPVLVKVKVDGVEQELPLEEVTKGYSRTADYTRKTQALAEERKAFTEKELTPVRAERQMYVERLAALENAVQVLMPDAEPDWTQLRDTSTPDEFAAAFDHWQANKGRIEQIQAERKRVLGVMEADAKAALVAKVKTEMEKLHAAWPEMADAEKGKALKADLIAYAKSPVFGFTDDDLNGVTDHRLLLLLDKARRFDEAQLRKPKIEEQIDRALDTMKPSGVKSKPRVSDVERAKGQLAASGRLDDAANALKLMGL